MKRIGQSLDTTKGTDIRTNVNGFARVMTRCFIACAFAAACHWQASAATINFLDWTAGCSGGTCTWSNTSSAGTVTGSSTGFSPSPGTWGVPTAITSQIFTNEFSANAASQVGTPLVFTFSAGYAWGTGGELILGNIHNYFEYTLEAWDSNGNPIDVNTWTTPTGLLGEYPSSAPGTMGYFSTSTTTRTALGFASVFSVSDSSASASGGQGGVLPLGNLVDVGRIDLTLTGVSVPDGLQVGSDFILFNVGTEAPEPAAYMLCGLGLSLMAFVRRRKR